MHNPAASAFLITGSSIYFENSSGEEKPLKFEAIFQDNRNRSEMVGLFLALLELIREKLIRIEQEKAFGTIYIFAQTEETAEKAVAHAISSTIDNIPSKHKEVLSNQPETEDKNTQSNTDNENTPPPEVEKAENVAE